MKNLFRNLLLLTSVLSLTLMFSCGDEDPDDEVILDPPTVIVDVQVEGADATSPASVEVGDSVSAALEITAPGNFNVFRVTIVKDGTTIGTREYPRTGLDVDDFTDFDANIVIMESIPDSLAGATITLEFEVVDDANEIGTAADFVLNVEEADANVFSPVTLEVPLENQTGENFFSTTTGEAYSSEEVTSTAESVSPLIDFGYYYGANDQASIASPAAFESTTFAAQVEGWNTKNSTSIRSTTIGASEFNEIESNADIDDVYEAGTDEEGIVSTLEEGNVVAFETVDGRRGLILVREINGTFNANDNIVLDVLVQSTED